MNTIPDSSTSAQISTRTIAKTQYDGYQRHFKLIDILSDATLSDGGGYFLDTGTSNLTLCKYDAYNRRFNLFDRNQLSGEGVALDGKLCFVVIPKLNLQLTDKVQEPVVYDANVSPLSMEELI